MTDFMAHFAIIEDPRIERCKKHTLLDILFLTVSAVLSGAQGWEAIEDFGHAKLEWLKRFIKLPNGIPRHDAIVRGMGRWNRLFYVPHAPLLYWVNALNSPNL